MSPSSNAARSLTAGSPFVASFGIVARWEGRPVSQFAFHKRRNGVVRNAVIVDCSDGKKRGSSVPPQSECA